jgi:DNA-binding NarL/FixJ family response regulator
VFYNYSTKEMATELGISYSTIKSHVFHVLMKFGVHSRQELRSILGEIDFEEQSPHLAGLLQRIQRR